MMFRFLELKQIQLLSLTLRITSPKMTSVTICEAAKPHLMTSPGLGLRFTGELSMALGGQKRGVVLGFSELFLMGGHRWVIVGFGLVLWIFVVFIYLGAVLPGSGRFSTQ